MVSVAQSIKFYFKAFVSTWLLAGCAGYGVLASVLLRIIGKKEYAQYTVGRVFYFTFSKVLGITITIKNEKYLKQKPAIVVSNHQTALDILILGRVFQPSYTVTAKHALKYFPILGWFMLASGTFFLNRAKGEKAKKVLNSALKDLKTEKRSLYMFPEGTRSASTDMDLLPFRKGAFHLAKQAAIPVIPLVVSNYSNIFNAKNRVFNRGEIVVEVLEPRLTQGLETNEDVTIFCNDVRDLMLKRLQEIGYARTPDGTKDSATSEREENFTDINTDSETEAIETITEETPLVPND